MSKVTPIEGEVMSRTVAKRTTSEAIPAPVSEGLAPIPILSILQAVMADPTMSPERINQAWDFYLRVDAAQAKKAFDAAMAAAQAEFPPIAKNRRVRFDSKGGGTTTDYRHEDLAQLVETCGPILAKHGISYRWRTENPVNEPIVVTCVLTHLAGHSEQNTLRGPRDESGNKNSLQGIASTVTYLERYTFKSGVGVASRHDDDGQAAGGSPSPERITEEQVKALNELILKTDAPAATIQIIFEHWKVDSLADLTPAQLTGTTAQLKKKLGK